MSKARELSDLGSQISVDGSGNSTFNGDVSAANLSTTGNVTVTGTVDGRDVAADGTKLDGIEAGAEVNTVDSVNTQTGAVVLDADDISDAATTNKFTTAADISKLAGIEAGADVTDTANVTAAGALMDSEVTNLAAVKAFDPTDYATAAQGTLADSAVQPSDSPTFSGGTFTGNVSFGDNDKATFGAGSDLQIYHDGLNSYIDDNGTGGLIVRADNFYLRKANDVENMIIGSADGAVTLYHDNATKLITTTTGVDVTGNITVSGTVDGRDVATDGTKLDGIEAGADVTDTANVTAAGALMDSELTNITAVKALNQGVATTNSPTFVGLNLSANLDMQDNDKILLGTGDDLQIYHDGANSYISEVGTGRLYLRSSSNITLQNSAGTETYINCTENGAVGIRYDNSEKLVTTSTGVSVTGTVAATAFSGDGSSLTNLPSSIPKQSTAPTSPATGDLWFDTASGQLRIYNGTIWEFVQTTPPITATGGTVTTSGGYKVHTFTSSGTFTVTAGAGGTLEYFIIAGGGGGNHNTSPPPFSGGGAGGVVIGSVTAQNTNYTITVGGGGSVASNGSNSSAFGASTAIGGGAGGGGGGGAGSSGGSGGGQGGTGAGSISKNRASGTAGQGNAGGAGDTGDGAGGGGGYSSVGQDASGSTAGNGGLGYANSWTGTEIKYAGGGGRTDQGYRGGYFGSPNGAANSGSGGAGTQGSGGSGIVVVRYLA